jgi:hypothetical protein
VGRRRSAKGGVKIGQFFFSSHPPLFLSLFSPIPALLPSPPHTTQPYPSFDHLSASSRSLPSARGDQTWSGQHSSREHFREKFGASIGPHLRGRFWTADKCLSSTGRGHHATAWCATFCGCQGHVICHPQPLSFLALAAEPFSSNEAASLSQ